MSLQVQSINPRDFLSQPRQIIRSPHLDTIEYPPIPQNDAIIVAEYLKQQIPSRNFAIHLGPQRELFIDVFQRSLGICPCSQATLITESHSTGLSIALASFPPATIVMDPTSELSGVYPASNEKGWDRVPSRLTEIIDMFPKTTSLQTAVVGTSALQNLSLFTAGNHDWLFILDPNDSVRIFWHNIERIVKKNSEATKAIEEILLFIKENQQLLGPIDESGSDIWESPTKRIVLSEITPTGRFYRLAQFLQSPKSPFLMHYEKIRTLFSQNHFFHLYLDLTNAASLQSFASILNAHNIAVDILYTSNVFQWVGPKLFSSITSFYQALQSPNLILLQSLRSECHRTDFSHLLQLHFDVFHEKTSPFSFSTHLPCFDTSHFEAWSYQCFLTPALSLIKKTIETIENPFYLSFPFDFSAFPKRRLDFLVHTFSQNPIFQKFQRLYTSITNSFQCYNSLIEKYLKDRVLPTLKDCVETLEPIRQTLATLSPQKKQETSYEYPTLLQNILRRHLRSKHQKNFTFFTWQEFVETCSPHASEGEKYCYLSNPLSFPDEETLQFCFGKPEVFHAVEPKLLSFLNPDYKELASLYKSVSGAFQEILEDLRPIFLEQHKLLESMHPEELPSSLCYPFYSN